jgi:transcriptional regulator with XRE-family HTH domain
MGQQRDRSLHFTSEGIALIEEAMQGKDWDKSQLAEQVEISYESICRYLRGERPPQRKNIEIIAKRLGLKPIDLVNPDEWISSTKASETKTSLVDWRSVSKGMLDNLKRLTTEALTAGDGIRFDFDDVFVPLGVVERQQKTKRKEDDGAPDRGSELYEEKVTPITHDEFFEDVLLRGNTRYSDGKRIAVIGEAGAGKTTQLQKIGSWLLEESDDIPVWISLTDLGAKSLREYLFKNWVREASGEIESAPQAWKDSLGDAIKSGKVWLLLDGVDEMTVSNPLFHLSTQLNKSWLKNVRVVLTCRVNVWDGGKNALTDFDVYRNLDFDYPDDVYKFIGKWFAHTPELSGSLKQALEQSGKERIRDMVKNPLRLTLLCYSWQLKQGELPETKAELYEWFVEAFYKWNKGKAQIELSRSQEDQLNRALGELAKRAIDGETSRFRLTKTFIENVFREFDIDLFDLALKLNWLNEIGVAAEDTLEKVYAFYHPSFQEYFAALAIDNWDFFLPKFVRNRSNTTTRYRVFESQWKEVILFWVGCDKITDNYKEEFIEKLIEFDDNCGEFYRFRTYLLAAEAIIEFKNCSVADSIVEQVMIWGFGSFDRKGKEWILPSDPIQKSTLAMLSLTDCKRVTANLCQMIDDKKVPNEIRDLAIEYLGFVALVGEEREQAINALINVIAAKIQEFNLCRKTTTLFLKKNPQPSIEDREKEEEIETNIDLTLTHSAWSLGVIGMNKESAIHALINLIDTFAEDISTYANVLNQAAWSLGQITFGQAKELSIPVLVRLMEYSESDFPYCQASSSLLKITNGERNEVLIRELISLLERSDSESVKKEASSFLRLLVLGEEWEPSNRNSSSKLTHANKEKSSFGKESIPEAILNLKDLSVDSYRNHLISYNKEKKG